MNAQQLEERAILSRICDAAWERVAQASDDHAMEPSPSTYRNLKKQMHDYELTSHDLIEFDKARSN